MNWLKLSILLLLAAQACSADSLNNRNLRPADSGVTEDTGAEDMGDHVDVDERPDMGDESDAADPIDMGGGICQPNRNGIIERSEVTLVAGLSAKFTVASDATWDTTGEDVDGEQTWDLAQTFASDRGVLVDLRDTAGQWFETDFPNADYFTPLSTTSDLLGIFQVTDDAVLLIGVVSPEDGLTATNLEYDPPVPVLAFPLEVGDEWSVESDVSGTFNGIVSVYTETYAFQADQEGTTLTPYGTFPTIRVRSVLDRQVGLLTTVIRSFAFVSECVGTVATVAAQENESGVEFSDVAELRRLAP